MEFDEKAKIILLTSSYPSPSNFVNHSFMTDLAESLSKKNIQVFVICPHKPDLPFREVCNNITIIRFSYWFTISGQKLGEAGGIVHSLRRSFHAKLQIIPFCISQFFLTIQTVRREKIILIHSHWIIPQGFIGACVNMIFGTPHITTIHGTDIHQIHSHQILFPLLRWIGSHSGYITCNSTHTHSLLRGLLGEQSVRTCILPMGINEHEFKFKLNSDNGEKKILFVGRLIAWKGVQYLIYAFSIVNKKNRDTQLIIIGDGPMREELERLSNSLNVASSIRFLGAISRDSLLTYYQNADLFVLPSIVVHNQTEGLGVVLLEAMAAGVPVIGSNIGGIPDIIEDGVNGMLVPPGDPTALADAMNQILGNSYLGERFRLAGLETISERFSWENISEQFIEVYQEVLNRSNNL